MIQRWRVEFENGGHLGYAVFKALPLADGTVAEITECGPSALFRGYPVFVKTLKVGDRPIMFIQGKWRMLRAKVSSITELEYKDALLVPKLQHKRASVSTAAGRHSVRRPAKRTGAPRTGKGRRKDA